MHVRVLGGGIVGLTIAEELARRGHAVHVLDPSPGAGASRAAAGMLCPDAETWHGEDALLRLGRASAALWPGLAERLDVALPRTGTLLVGVDAGDVQEVDRQVALLGGTAQEMGSRELRLREPGLGAVAGGALLPGDHSIDPRAVVAALLERVEVRAADDRDVDVTVVATGAASAVLPGVPVRPVRGEIVRLSTDDPPTTVVRAWVHGEQVYVVPRPPDADGRAEVVVGATSLEAGGPPRATVEGVVRLLGAAREVLPGLDRAEVVEVMARDRPGTPDNLPLVGAHPAEPRTVLAVGHHRHGVLLAPITAALVAAALDGAEPDPALDPRRFLAPPLKPAPLGGPA